MAGINWVRLIIGGLLAAIIAFLSDGFLHEQLLSADWKSVYDNLGAPEPVEHGTHLVYFAIFELGRGLVSIFVYVMMRPHFKPGPRLRRWLELWPGLPFQSPGRPSLFPWDFSQTHCGVRW